MKFSTVERWISGVGIVAIAGGAYWLGSLNNRVSQLEERVNELRMGPRGENCQLIVAKLAEQPNDQALRQLADDWGCAWMPAIQADEEGAATQPNAPTG